MVPPLRRCAIVPFTRKVMDGMIDFNEELKNFKPCLNVEQAEEAIYSNDLKDFTDLVRDTVEDLMANRPKED